MNESSRLHWCSQGQLARGPLWPKLCTFSIRFVNAFSEFVGKYLLAHVKTSFVLFFFLSLLFEYSPSPTPFPNPTRVENADVSGKERVCAKSSLFLILFIPFQKTASLNFLYPHLQLVELRYLFFVHISSLIEKY